MLVEELRHAGRIPPQRGWHAPAHRHEGFHELVVVLSGDMQVRIAGSTFSAAAGDALYYPPGVLHEERTTSSRSFELLFLAWRGDPIPLEPVLVHDRAGRIRQLAIWLCEIPVGDPRASTLATALLQERRQLSLEQDGFATVLRRFLSEHLADAVGVADMAGALHLSRWHFSRRCREATGASPRRYLERLRVDAVRALLTSTALPLRRIAEQTGLGDAYNLSRVFKRVTGRSPGALRA